MSSAFLIKFRVVYYSTAASLRHCSTIYFFLKKRLYFFKQLVFVTFLENNLINILYSKVTV